MKNYLFLLAILISSTIMAQSDWCGTTKITDEIKLHQKEYNMMLNQNYSQGKNVFRINSNTDTIPVVVHVVNNFGTTVSDADIHAMVTRINTDLAKLNSDTTTLPAPFAAIAGSVPVYLSFALRDFNGAMTDGIVRVTSTHAPFSNNFSDLLDLESSASGGDEIWPTNKFFNIYITDLATGLAGFATIGRGPLAIDYASVLSRAPTHEMGHALGLQHIWGTSGTNGTCSDDDGISDTPLQWGPSLGCPPFPTYDSCTVSGNGIMYVNYMDYSICGAMFSQGQCDSMLVTFNRNYNTLLTSPALIPVPPDDAGCTAINSPSGTVCTQFQPVIKIRNWGNNNLTSAIIHYQFDNGAILNYTWTGLLNNYQTDDVILPSVTLSAGSHNITAFTSDPNGNPDQDYSNDTSESNFVVTQGNAVPYSEGFETAFPPSGWNINNPENNITWIDTTEAYHGGTHSMMYYNHAITSWDDSDEVSFMTNISGASAAQLSFYVAHTYTINSGFSDTLRVYVSDNCGISFSKVYDRYDASLITAPPGTISQNYHPVPGDFRKDSIDLSAFTSSTNPVIIKFTVINAWAQELYIDDINIDGVNVNVSEIPGNYINIFPNPFHSGFRINFPGNNISEIKIYGLDDKCVFNDFLRGETDHINLDVNPGLYFVEINDGKNIIRKKIMVQ